MLTPVQWFTMQAALSYWEQEITPHGLKAAQPYLPGECSEFLTTAQVQVLQSELRRTQLMHVVVDRSTLHLQSPLLHSGELQVLQVQPSDVLASVLLPGAPEGSLTDPP